MIETIEIDASFIPLTQNQVAIVDTKDYNYLNQWKWYARKDKNNYYVGRQIHLGYVDGKRKQKSIAMHRLIADAPTEMMVDHINGNGLDNRKTNLRICSPRQNSQNQKNRKKNKSSKYPGVCWYKRDENWKASIYLNGKRKHLGYFNDELEAAKAYEKACREIVGEELICKKE